MQLTSALIQSGWLNVFDGTEIGVMFLDNGGGENLIVTFDYLSGNGHGRQKLDGQSLYADLGFDQLHFSTAKPNWYQSSEMTEALVAGRRIRDRYSHVIMYGGSQGGYAALLFSGDLDPTKVIAYAPQFSVDPVKAPFERRFDAYVGDIAFVNDDMLKSASSIAKKYIVYDPYEELDRAHFMKIRSLPNTFEVRLPFAGHLPAEFLNEANLLKDAATHLIVDDDPISAIRKISRTGRYRSPRYMIQLGMALARKGNLRGAIRALNIAYILNPESISVIEAYFAVFQGDGIWTGVAHALLRLIKKERPDWTQYDSAQHQLWQQLLSINALRPNASNN